MTDAGILMIGFGLGSMMTTLTSIYIMTMAVREDRIKKRLRQESHQQGETQ